MTARYLVTIPLCLLSCLSRPAPAAVPCPAVNESARQIPVASQVDVVVVGGSTGAVSAACEAARAGAKVFLAAPYPYLGDDMTAVLRLWLEPGETPAGPLARRIFRDTLSNPDLPSPYRLDFAYEADRPSAGVHRDTRPPRMLCDCTWGDPYKQSVQYDGDVNLVLDLGKTRPIERVRVMAHHSGGASPYKVASITALASDDKSTWKEASRVKNTSTGTVGGACVTLTVPVKAEARYVKLVVKKAADAKRILLGEVEVIGPAPPGGEPQVPKFRPPRPMHVKKVLDDALLEAGVEFLYSCYPTDVLRDADGNPCGIVMANRAGRQAVVAKTIIDATDRAVVARMAGARLTRFRGGTKTLFRVVIGGEPRSGDGIAGVREIPPPYRGPYPNAAGTSSGEFKIFEYTLKIPVAEDTPTAWAAAEQRARTLTYHPEQQFTADALARKPYTPSYPPVIIRLPKGGTLGVDACRPEGVARLYVLGGRINDREREYAETLMSPLALMELGPWIGRAAAKEAKSLPAPKGAHLPGEMTDAPLCFGEVREFLAGVRPGQKVATVPQAARALPVLGMYDVVVIGGGTAGAPAGIGAARRGAKTLVVEHLHALGGVSTTGAISKYCAGNRVGFTAEVAGGASWVIEQRAEWFRQELLKAGADVWFGSVGCGALVRDGYVRGAIVVTPQGRGVVLAKTVIDATGNADVAAAAGAECRYTGAGELAMQGTGLPPRWLGATYTNTDYTITDETDLRDVWQLLVNAKAKFPAAFDLGQLVDTRERRMIVGDFTVTIPDQMAERTYPDTIVRARSNYDTHGYIVAPYLLLKHPLRYSYATYLPYRCLLPKGLEGILVSGIGISAQRDAQPLVRMQPDVQNQGYAAGVAAAIAAKAGVEVRHVDVRALQKHLVAMGALPKSVLTDKDSFPVGDRELAAAVASIQDESQGLALVLAHPDRAIPLLEKAHGEAQGRAKVRYAKVLGMLGDAAAAGTLIAEARQAKKWDAPPSWNIGKDYEGYRDVGWGMSHLDNTILALGHTRSSEAVPVLVEKLKLFTPKSPFSHFRAVAMALELIGDPRAAEPLAEMLSQPEMSGFAQTSLERARQLYRGGLASPASHAAMQNSLREVALARALLRCGDHRGLGRKTLTEYTRDLRGHFARHARAVLESAQ